MSYSRDSTEPYRKRPRGSCSSSRNSDFGAKFGKYPKFSKPITDSDPNSILRFTVWNAHYEIITENLNCLFGTYGVVLRAVIFKTDGMPGGMVEMADIEGACRAKECLNGFTMYSDGSNTLQVEFAWTSRLFVLVNDMYKSWDFTKSFNGPVKYYPEMAHAQAQQVYYDPGYQYHAQQYYQNYAAPVTAVPQLYNGGFNGNVFPPAQVQQKYQNQNDQQPMVVFASTPMRQQNVLHISGLGNEISNPDKVFNLLSLYGNVAKVQFLRSRQGTALVQMFDSMSVEYCIRYLNNVSLGSNGRLQICWATPNYYPSSAHQFTLLDGSQSFKDFTESKNQRFLVPRPEFWLQPPSKIVRYYNIPASLTEENVKEVLENQPRKVRALKMRTDEESGLSRGLLEFSSVAQALCVVMKFNNKEIRSSKKTPHFMKLCFSSSSSLDLKN